MGRTSQCDVKSDLGIASAPLSYPNLEFRQVQLTKSSTFPLTERSRSQKGKNVAEVKRERVDKQLFHHQKIN